jgi:hypothetical protein
MGPPPTLLDLIDADREGEHPVGVYMPAHSSSTEASTQ